MAENASGKNKWLIRIALIIFFIVFSFLGLINTEYVQKNLFYPLLYEKEIIEYATKNNVSAAMVAAVIKNESHFVASAVSNSGAVGLMQIMPETAEWIAKEMGWQDFDKKLLSEPAANIRLGCWYLSELEHEFENEKAALAAYNAGRGQVKEWLDNGIWDGKDLNKIPFDETRRYVDNVLADKKKYKGLYNNF